MNTFQGNREITLEQRQRGVFQGREFEFRVLHSKPLLNMCSLQDQNISGFDWGTTEGYKQVNTKHTERKKKRDMDVFGVEMRHTLR